jgi:hypothetical protein
MFPPQDSGNDLEGGREMKTFCPDGILQAQDFALIKAELCATGKRQKILLALQLHSRGKRS